MLFFLFFSDCKDWLKMQVFAVGEIYIFFIVYQFKKNIKKKLSVILNEKLARTKSINRRKSRGAYIEGS